MKKVYLLLLKNRCIMKKKRKLNKKKLALFIIVLVFFFKFLLSLIKIISYLKDNKDNKKIQETIINDSITIIEPIEEDQKIEYNIDFKALKEQNSDTFAYLKVNNTNIDYIVVKGNDNSYYLKHNFEKRWNVQDGYLQIIIISLTNQIKILLSLVITQETDQCLEH